MESLDNDQRRAARLDIYWKVYYNNYLWGYVLDLSETGIKMTLSSNYYPEKNEFEIHIKPPVESSLEEVFFMVKKVWDNHNKTKKFYEVGCEFHNLLQEKQITLEKMLRYFKESNWIESLKTELNL